MIQNVPLELKDKEINNQIIQHIEEIETINAQLENKPKLSNLVFADQLKSLHE